MNLITKIVLFIAFLGLGYLIAGFLPSRVMERQENQADFKKDGVQLQDKSRANFQNETLPKFYPQLVNFLKETNSETLSWRTESGEDKNIYLSFSHSQGLTIETELYIGASQNDTPISAQPLHVRMIDNNTDGIMDSIEMTKSNGDSNVFQEPFDEIQKYMWDVSLAIAFKLSKCCS